MRVIFQAKRLYDVFHEPFLKPKKKKQQNADAPSTSTKGIYLPCLAFLCDLSTVIKY